MQRLGVVLLCSTIAIPVQTQVSAGTVPAQSVAQRFTAAMALLDGNKPADALQAFELMEADLIKAAKPKMSNLALVRAYKAQALLSLSRNEDAKVALTLAFDSGALDVPANFPARKDARITMARILTAELDDAGAAEIYRLVAVDETDPYAKSAYQGVAALRLAVLDPTRAVAMAKEAVTVVEALPKPDKTALSDLYRSLGRAQLNAGQLEEARVNLKKAISKTGGLDLKINYTEYATRSDAAITALRLNDKEEARKLLAYTGAGRTDVSFPTGIEMVPPQCGGVDGLKPNDMAIVEFAVGKDGEVNDARPVFSNRPGQMAYAFARAVSDWRWDPNQISKQSGFFLSTLRVEVRCTNSASRSSVVAELAAVTDNWMSGKLDSVLADYTSIKRLKLLKEMKAKLLEPEIQANKVLGAALALMIAESTQSSRDDSRAEFANAARLLREAGAPPSAWLYPAVLANRSNRASLGSRAAAAQTVQALANLHEEPSVKADLSARAALGLVVAEFHARARQPEQERVVLNQIINDMGLAEKDPSRIAALLALANMSIVVGDTAGAKAAYEKTGLSARQCAALESKPVMLRTNVSSDDFPLEAMQWGFEGWARQEFDIGADGRTQNVRTVVAFPPAVFAKAAEGMAKEIRYRSSFRPEGGLGCGAETQNIAFRMP